MLFFFLPAFYEKVLFTDYKTRKFLCTFGISVIYVDFYTTVQKVLAEGIPILFISCYTFQYGDPIASQLF